MNIIVAYDKNRLIGETGKIPWNLKQDRLFFKETTMGHPMIMGWNTWLSFNEKPLRGRPHIILTRKKNPVLFTPKDCIFTPRGGLKDGRRKSLTKYEVPIMTASSIDEAIAYAEEFKNLSNKEIFVIGGSQIYEQFLNKNLIDKVIATEVHWHYKGDAYFPVLRGEWDRKVVLETRQFNIIEYQKMSNSIKE